MANDWYTKTTWTDADQADFFARLKRSRTTANKAQYLRIQAAHLERVGTPELLRAAITLLDMMLTEFPERFELALAYEEKAVCLGKLGNLEQAVTVYRLAFEAERKYPNMRTQALHGFGRLVVENELTQFYDEALAVLDEMTLPGIEFPSDIYKRCGIRAIVAAHKGEVEPAKQLAAIALEAAAKVHSGFRYHPTFGLVNDRQSKFYKAIEKIAMSQLKSFAN